MKHERESQYANRTVLPRAALLALCISEAGRGAPDELGLPYRSHQTNTHEDILGVQ